MPALLFAAVAAAAAACGGGAPIPDQDLLLRVTAGAHEVELGQPFPLTVQRVWGKDLVPEDWSDEALAPLVLRLEETKRREDARRIEETRRYQAHAFTLDDVVIAAPVFRARPRDGGPERVAAGEELSLRVRPALDRAAPGPAELPGEPLAQPSRRRQWWWAGAIGLAALALALWSWRRRLRPPPAPPPVVSIPASDPPQVRAWQRLQRLAEQQPRSAGEIDAWHVEAASLARDYVGERCALRAAEMTTEELRAALEAARVLHRRHQELLASVLAQCDLVKFARHAPPASERERLLETVAAFLRATGAVENRAGETA
ncbi:MAG: hypothetical protein EYC70_15960 [Planctomycetota bacterium]|nr:MAG: hypothetical protein EYC70_15960 [Planctomycetota bacterium]